MKRKLLSLVAIAAVLGCHSKQQNSADGKRQEDTSSYTPQAKIIKQTIPDKTYPNLQPGEVAPDAVTVDADRILSILNGACVIQKGGVYALVDLKGNFIVPFDVYTYPDVENSAVPFTTLIRVQGKTLRGSGFINVKGEVVFPWNSGDDFMPFNAYGIAGVSSPNSHNKYIDVNGTRLGIPGFNADVDALPHRDSYNKRQSIDVFPVLQSVKDDKAGLSTHQAWLFVNKQNEPLFPIEYQDAGPFTEGLAPVQVIDQYRQSLWGYINTKGQTVIPPSFTNRPGPFHNGLALIKPKWDAGVDFKYAYIDRKGEIKIKVGDSQNLPYQPEDGNFINGYAFWKDSYHEYLMDTSGTTHQLTELAKQPDLAADESGLYLQSYGDLGIMFQVSRLVANSKGVGLMDYNGNVVFPPIFEILRPDYYSPYALASVKLGTKPGTSINELKSGVVNHQGVFVLIVEPKHNL